MRGHICLFALCFLIFDCPITYGQTTKKTERSTEWEYKQLTFPSDDVLNHYAKEGWEIATAAGGGGDGGFYKVILKRSKSHPLFGTKTAELPKPEPPPQAKCTLTLAQAPVIRGLRLGMTSDELFTIFPANERGEFDRTQRLKSAEIPPNYGYVTFQISISDYPTGDRFTGISVLTIGLLDRKVVSIDAHYFNAPQFDRPGQLLGIAARQFGLPEYKDWLGYNEYSSNPLLTCDGFVFQLQGYSGSFSILVSDSTYKKIIEDRRQADLARKRENFKL
jgi:hypothetical protein